MSHLGNSSPSIQKKFPVVGAELKYVVDGLPLNPYVFDKLLDETVEYDGSDEATFAAPVFVTTTIWSGEIFISVESSTVSFKAISSSVEIYFERSAISKLNLYSGVAPIISSGLEGATISVESNSYSIPSGETR